jgi:hypothetical protein
MTRKKITFCATVTFVSLAATAPSPAAPAVHLAKNEGVTLAQATSVPPAATSHDPVQPSQSGAAGPGMQRNMPEMAKGRQEKGMKMKEMGQHMESQDKKTQPNSTTTTPK